MDDRRKERELRELIVVRGYEDGLTQVDVAEAIGTTVGTVAQLIRDMRRAGVRVEKQGGDHDG